MKKLLVAAIGAAVAFGAFADQISTQRFKKIETGSIAKESLSNLDGAADPTGTYWSDPAGITNEYTVSAVASVGEVPLTFDDAPGNVLDIKTKFGNPLSVNAVSGGTTNIPSTGIYFDSLVKFTVCDSDPDQTYTGAKIVMWLQESDTDVQPVTTNLYVRAGYLSYGNSVTVVPTNYVCGTSIGADFVDKWHRVTIKAMKDITTDTGVGDIKVPGFAIFIDGEDNIATGASSDAAKWDSAFESAFALTEAATQLGTKLFPSMIQDDNDDNKLTIAAAAFDGTGSIADIAFTDTPPADFAKDPAAPDVSEVIVDDVKRNITTLAEAVAAANGATTSAQITLGKSIAIDDPLVFSGNATITLDFAGFVLTNELADAMITNSAAALIVTDSVGTGGIVCGEEIPAIYQSATSADAISVTGGNFWATPAVKLDENYTGTTKFISGGAFASDMGEDAEHLVDGKAFDEPSEETGLYPVVDYVPTTTFTIGFAYGDPLETNEQEVAEGELPSEPTAEDVAIEGKGFTGWDDTVVAAVADKVYTAQYTNNIYTITFVIGENSSSQQLEYGSTISSVPNVPVLPGYTGSWDDDPAGDTVTGNKTYTYTYTGKAYTVNTYTNNALYATYSGTYAGSAPTLENPVVGEGQSWDGKWYTENGGETEFSFNPDAVDAQSAYATVTEDEPTPVTPVTPAKNLTPPAGTTPAEYAAEINGNPAAYIAVPSAAEATSSTYLSLMKAQVSATDSSKVEIVFNKEAEAYVTVTNQVEAAVAAIPVAAAASETQSFNLTAGSATPGLWYSVTSGNSLTGMSSHSTSVQAAADGSVTGLQAPTYPAKGFYRIDVSPTQDYTPAP